MKHLVKAELILLLNNKSTGNLKNRDLQTAYENFADLLSQKLKKPPLFVDMYHELIYTRVELHFIGRINEVEKKYKSIYR